ncbi:MAG TPA: hypothetical protein VFB12_01340 [Ktedonobacteraceae bacterium]|nr:hypothetical protein [Ktedonobacteraceae bacterium]
MAKSEVAKFREQQALQEQAVQQGIHGLAIVANHESITARMERSAEYLLKLLEEGKHKEVALLMETPTWGLEGNVLSCHTTTSA